MIKKVATKKFKIKNTEKLFRTLQNAQDKNSLRLTTC